MFFEVKEYRLPHEGVIPGARGHKKITIPRGTKVYCIVYENTFFWAAYLSDEEAQKVCASLEETIKLGSKRHIELKTLLAWNFKRGIPVRISRPKLSPVVA